MYLVLRGLVISISVCMLVKVSRGALVAHRRGEVPLLQIIHLRQAISQSARDDSYAAHVCLRVTIGGKYVQHDSQRLQLKITMSQLSL